MKSTIVTGVAMLATFTFSRADIFQLTFEGLGNLEPVGSFYAGGLGGSGSGPGVNYGVIFDGPTLAIIDGDSGGTGNFGNEPSPDTIMFFLSGGAATMSVPAGFTTGFSFYYATSQPASVEVYDDIEGGGSLLASLGLDVIPQGETGGDPNGFYDLWTPVGVSFSGTAKSVKFIGAADYAGFDDITFGSSTPIVESEVPEAGTYAAGAFLAAAVGGLWLRRRKIS